MIKREEHLPLRDLKPHQNAGKEEEGRKKKNVSFPLQEHAKIQLLSTEEVVTALGARSAPSQDWKDLVVVLLLGGCVSQHAGSQLCPGAVPGLWGSFARCRSAGALRRMRSAICLIFSCSTSKEKGENQHRLQLTLCVLVWGLVNLFTT